MELKLFCYGINHSLGFEYCAKKSRPVIFVENYFRVNEEINSYLNVSLLLCPLIDLYKIYQNCRNGKPHAINIHVRFEVV